MNKLNEISLVVLGIGMLLASSVFAGGVTKDRDIKQSPEIILRHKKPLTLELSNSSINRLNFKDTRIVKIIGDQNKFGSKLSSDGSNLFLTSNVPAGDSFDISVMDVHSVVFDLHLLVVEKKEPTIVVLKLRESNKENLKQKVKAQQMINAMKTGFQDKYYVEPMDRLILLKQPKDLLVKQYVQYRSGNLWGVGLEVSNIAKNKFIAVLEKDLANNFENVVAINVDQRVLDPMQSSKVFLIFASEGL